jgi:hypothetical protein
MPELGEFFHPYNVRAFPNLEAPVLKAPVVEGTPGTTSYTYAATFITLDGETAPSPTVTVTTGPATLNGFDKIKLEVEAVPRAARKVRYYKDTVSGLRLLGEVDPSPGRLYDTGQAVQTGVIPTTENTSGRPNWLALGYHPGEYAQRQEWMDLQAMIGKGFKGIGDRFWKDGDIAQGGEKPLGANVWGFVDYVVYLYGYFHVIPYGEVTLTGTGKEVVGLRVTETWIPPDVDPVLKASADEGVAPEYAQQGADRLVLEFTWVVDESGQVNIREFLDGQPLIAEHPTDYSVLEKKIAQTHYDISGDCVIRPFPMKMIEHASDATQNTLKIEGGGKALVQGFPQETIAVQRVDIPKGRDVKSVNNAILDPFEIPGGSVLGTVSETFNVSGLAIKLKVGAGNYHTVSLTGSGQTAAQVAAQISGSVNAYPTSGSLVYCQGVEGHLQIQALEGKSLEIAAVASDAYTILGLTPGTYLPQGQRIYLANHQFIKTTTDLQFVTEVVEAVTHNGTTHKDLLAHENVSDIIGASNVLLDAHDAKGNYQKNIDFAKSGDYIDFSGLGGADPANGQTYFVKYRYNRNAVRGTRERVRVIDAQVVKGSEDSIDTIVFTGATSAVAVKSGNPVTGLSGSAKDVIRILRVNDTSGQSQTEYDSYSLVKGAGALSFDVSKISWASAGAQGAKPAGQPNTGATYYVSFEFWNHTVEGDFLAADSYLNDYEEIELAPNQTWNLRDCVDFRTVNGIWPVHGESPRFDYEFYLSRIDKIALRSDAHFVRIPGIPEEIPVPPGNQAGPLNIAMLFIPPYTYHPGDVTVQTLEVQRITQWGLNEDRADIQRLKYDLAIYLANKEATDNTAAQDAQRIIVDPLTGQGRCDVAFDKGGVTFTAAIDPTERCIRLPVAEDGRAITVDEANSTGLAKVGKVIVFDYTETPYVRQLKATRIMNINPHAVYGWIGTIELDPEEDYWTDILQLPDVDVNYENEMQALTAIAAENAERARSVTYGAWRLLWDNSGGWAGGQQLQSNTDFHWSSNSNWGTLNNLQVNAARERSGTYKSVVPERKLIDVGDRVVDISVIPFMREIEINLAVHGLKPNINIACTIDGHVVDLVPTGTSQMGTLPYDGHTTVKTKGSGGCSCKFTVPPGIRVGQKPIKVFSASNPEESYAISTFFSQGFRNTVQHEVMGIISTVERDEVVTQTAWHYGDPLCETVAVTNGTEYLSYVDIYFQSKDTDLPVTVELRKTINGMPSRTVIASATLYPAQITCSDDATVRTRFRFPNLVGYSANEYGVHLITNCQSYNVWVAVMGETDIRTGQIVRQQAYDGVLFTSPNDSTWIPNPEMDLMFEVGTANFENNAQVVFNEITGIEANAMISAVTQMLPVGCNLHWAYSLNSGASWEPFISGVDTDLAQIATKIKLRADVSGSGGTFQISESGAGIILLLNDPAGDYVSYNAVFADPANTVTLLIPLAVDGTNGAGTRTVTPYYSVDDGEHWVEIDPAIGYSPVAVGDGTYRNYKFETPAEKTLTGASNATPIVITSAGHGHHNDGLVTITGVTGNTNANGTFRVKNRTADAFELVNPTTGANIAGNGVYGGGGAIKTANFTQIRGRLHLATSNRAVTPKCGTPQWFPRTV